MRHWLMKSEPGEYSIDDLVKHKKAPWFGVRNYQARNFMMNDMTIGDPVFFYHSSCPEPGIAGLAEVCSTAYPDETQFDRNDPHFEPAAKKDAPRWFNVDVKIVKKTPLIGLSSLREHAELAQMRILAKGNRLSITPITVGEWNFITKKLMRL
ncbi:MAG: EVE domain-containing protein [Burkholderiales bacterium]